MSWFVRTNDFKKSEFSVDVTEIQKSKSLTAAAKKMALFWGLAVFSVFIPVMHFFLVPLFLIVGVVAFFAQTKKTHYLEDGFYICPACQKPVHVKKLYFQDQQKLNCELCNTQLVLIQE